MRYDNMIKMKPQRGVPCGAEEAVAVNPRIS